MHYARIAVAAAILLTGGASAHAEMASITIARQPSLGHLPLMIMEDRGLLEEKAAELGHEGLTVDYATLAGGAAMNDALLSGSIQFAAGGVPPLLILWSRTVGTANEVKAAAAMNSMPLLMNTTNPDIASIRDLTESDRIALPAVGVSVQAMFLQMAAEKEFGEGNHHQLDNLTVTMSHTDGHAALMARQEVTAHFSAPPIQDLQLREEGVTNVLNTFDILGGPATFNLVWTSARFRDENPIIYEAFVAALEDAVEIIATDRDAAVETYLRLGTDASDEALIESILDNPQVTFTTTPQNVGAYLDFMAKVGTLTREAESWRDVFFENVHEKDGS